MFFFLSVAFFFGVKEGMRAFVGIAVVALCAVAAHALYFEYADELTKAYSLLPDGAQLGHFRALLQVPPEPKLDKDQTVIFFVGAWGNQTQGSSWIMLSGMGLVWKSRHWVAAAGSIVCRPAINVCEFSSPMSTDLKVETGDVVVLNVTDLQKQSVVGYEVSVPNKGLSSGTVTKETLNQRSIVGVYVAAAASGVWDYALFPDGNTKVLKVGYSMSMNPAKEVPLKWEVGEKSSWMQKFTQDGDYLNFNWQY